MLIRLTSVRPTAFKACTTAVVFLAATLVALSGGSRPVHAAAFTTKAKQAILIDYETGAILYQKDADQLVAPASMSKLATLAVVFDRLRKGTLKLDDTFVISEHAWRDGGAPSRTSAMFAPLGKPVSIEDLVQGIAIQSGNDASIAVAEGIAGTDAAFAKLMTQYMRRIGLEKSTFGNPTGLPHPDQLMTAREIGLLAKHLIAEYPEYYQYFGMRKFPYQPEGRRRPYAFFNRNPLLGALEGADGLKTGHLEASGYGLVGSAVQDGQRLIAVVHGLTSREERKTEAVKLMQWGFRSFTPYDLYESDEIVGNARVWGGDKFYVPLRGKGTVKVLLPKFPLRQKLTAEIVYKAPLKPPIKEGQQVAVLRVTSASNAVNEVPLYAAEEVPEGSLVRKGLDSLIVMAWRWVADKASNLLEKI
ncbi:MAG: D-alanyl-D-alanine carboxypeptidase [Alphaproteobacteria bacterium BRH_c36]|nr:MAG: D-alanyl-D-alanine carboxypeptidase [Alphaproteobacteria bacterium BRH_c36]